MEKTCIQVEYFDRAGKSKSYQTVVLEANPWEYPNNDHGLARAKRDFEALLNEEGLFSVRGVNFPACPRNYSDSCEVSAFRLVKPEPGLMGETFDFGEVLGFLKRNHPVAHVRNALGEVTGLEGAMDGLSGKAGELQEQFRQDPIGFLKRNHPVAHVRNALGEVTGHLAPDSDVRAGEDEAMARMTRTNEWLLAPDPGLELAGVGVRP